MTPIKEPCRVGNVSTPGIIFLGKRLGPPRRLTRRARTRSRNRLAFSLPRPYARVPVLLGCPDHTWPARCSRDTAMVAVFRLASSHPDRKPGPDRGSRYKTARPSKGGEERSGEVGSWPQWPERAPRQGAKVTRRISGESEPLCVVRVSHRALRLRPINSDEHSAKQVRGAGRAAAGAGASRQARGVILLAINRSKTAK